MSEARRGPKTIRGTRPEHGGGTLGREHLQYQNLPNVLPVISCVSGVNCEGYELERPLEERLRHSDEGTFVLSASLSILKMPFGDTPS
jgi:hypothetical protein